MRNTEQEEAWLKDAYEALGKELDIEITLTPFPDKAGYNMAVDCPPELEDLVEARLQQIIEQVNP